MQDPTTRHSYVQINNSFVHLFQYGLGENLVRPPSAATSPSSVSSTTKSSPNNKASTDKKNPRSSKEPPIRLIIFVPGNPGILGIYHDFLIALCRTLSNSTGKNSYNQPIILAIGHNNFDHPDHVTYRSEERICVLENDLNFVERALAKKHLKEPHHIELQVLNKLIILKRLLRVDITECKLLFIGHSIGCYIILRLLQDKLVASSHEGSIMIHPALENLSITGRGLVCDRFFRYKLDWIILPIAFIIDTLLPKPVKFALTKWFCTPEYVRNSSDMAMESVMQLVCQKTLKALFEMAKSEFALVKNLNTDTTIKPHVSKLKLIYAINDDWVNTDNRTTLKELYPDLYMEEQPTLHAFVMDPQTVMDYAVKIGMLIQDLIETIE